MSGQLHVSKVLAQAADLLEGPDAWMRDDFCNRMGASRTDIMCATCWCIAGAIANVLEVDGPDGEQWLLDNNVAELVGIEGVGGLVGWNDHPERTQAQVVAKLREAAAGAGPAV